MKGNTMAGINVNTITPQSDKGPEIKQQVKLNKKEEPEETKEKKELRFCPSCGTDLWQVEERPISQEEKGLWLRHILGENRFTKKYKLFGGRIEITLRTRTVAESEFIFQQLRKEPAPLPTLGVEPALLHKANQYMLTYSLKSLVSHDEKIPSMQSFPEVTEDKYPKADENDDDLVVARAFKKNLQSLPEALLNAMINTLTDFDSLVHILQQHSNDSDFWPATDDSI